MACLHFKITLKDNNAFLGLEQWCWRNKIKPQEKEKLAEILGRIEIQLE